jgi:hypothetical protein
MKSLILFLLLIFYFQEVNASSALQVAQGVFFIHNHLTPKHVMITVDGKGNDESTAIQNALQEAVYQVVGVLIVSERHVENDSLVRNLVAEYSSGTVKTYEKQYCVEEQSVVSCRIRATVTPSEFARKLRNVSDVVQIDGNVYYQKHMANQRMLMQREKVTEYYLKQIWRSGLDVKIISVELIPDTNKNVRMNVTYDISWNRKFRRELIDFLTMLERDTKSLGEDSIPIHVQWDNRGMTNNRAVIKTHDIRMYNNMMRLMNQPLRLGIKELNTCSQIDIGNIFQSYGSGYTIRQTISITPEELKKVKRFTAHVGCDS